MLKKYITDFLAYCKVIDLSPKSFDSLHANLRDFAVFIEEQQVEAAKEITYAHLSDFVADFKTPTIHKKKARVWSLRKFFHFLTLTNLISENIAMGIPYPKIEKTVHKFLTIEEFKRIIAFFAVNIESPNGLRNLVLILFLGLLGLRSGTVIAINVEHVDTENGLAWVTEKGRKQRQIVLPDVLNTLLKIFISQHIANKGPLFFSKRKKRISPRSLQEIFRSVADSLGIEKRLHAHLFRHTAATHLNRVAGTTVTQAVLGHQRRYNTLKYAHLNPDQYAVYMKRHPFMREV